MSAPLNASASQAGALFANSNFEIPQFQREYSWQIDEVSDFWNDLNHSLHSDQYFLGLIILTDEGGTKKVVDGQQRLITLTLLANALYYEANRLGRTALADRIQADFLRSIDYDTDEQKPRLVLSDDHDNATLQYILDHGEPPQIDLIDDADSISKSLTDSFEYIRRNLADDLRDNAFKKLGVWAEFITNQLYFAVFVHPDPASAYQVFEVINTRGRELTTADLLKNFILSQSHPADREQQYNRWQELSRRFSPDGANNTLVQFIRHAITVRSGHILPKDLYSFLAGRRTFSGRRPPAPNEIIDILENEAPLYLQMIDPTLSGPAEGKALQVFSSLNSLGVLAVRPILLALFRVPDSADGMDYLLRLVVRRIVVGNLGTGNVERRLGEAAKNIAESRNWTRLTRDLSDLNPPQEEFVEQLRKRSFNKNTLTFMRRSIIQGSTTPEINGVLHFIWPKNTADWEGFAEEDSFWSSTIGNTFLAGVARRPKEATVSWAGFKASLLKEPADGELDNELSKIQNWNAVAIEEMGRNIATEGGAIWY